MLPDDPDVSLLWDMRTYALQARTLVDGLTYTRYREEPAVTLAVERSIEIIGEAARRVSREFQQAHPEIAWRQMVGLRNILAHQYAAVDSETMWQIVTEYVPELIRHLDALLDEAGTEGD